MPIAIDGVVLGMVCVGLVTLVGVRCFPSRPVALLAPLFFAMTPLVVHAVRASTPVLVQLACVLGWMAALQFTVTSRRGWSAAIAGLSLGLAMYTQPGALVTAPLLALVGIASVRAAGVPLSDFRVLTMVAVFVAVSVPVVLRLLMTDALDRLVMTHGLYDASRFNVMQGMREMVSWVGLVARSEVYYDTFIPSLWFLSGGTVRHALGEPRAFLLPMAVLIPAGVHRVITGVPSASAIWIIGGMLMVPVAAALSGRPPVAARLLILVPFATVLAVHGAVHLASSRHPIAKVAGIVAAAAVPLTFAVFVFR